VVFNQFYKNAIYSNKNKIFLFCCSQYIHIIVETTFFAHVVILIVFEIFVLN
jgi:hypothetical protein